MADAERAREVLSDILRRMGIEAEVAIRDEEDKIVLDVQGPETNSVIGKKGATLEALQFLLVKIIHKGVEPEAEAGGKPFVVDAEAYRARRVDSLVEMAHRLADKVKQTGKAVKVDPMSPHDRRVIHLALDKEPGVTTRSEGEGSFRRLVILPAPDKV